MTIPQSLAKKEGIPFVKDQPTLPMTANGRATENSYISPVYFSFPQLPQWEFKVDCAFSPCNLRYGLFGMTDFVPHFVVRSQRMSPGYPEGSVIFQLRADHGGVRRA